MQWNIHIEQKLLSSEEPIRLSIYLPDFKSNQSWLFPKEEPTIKRDRDKK